MDDLNHSRQRRKSAGGHLHDICWGSARKRVGARCA